jgi:hypothetical protein
VAIESDRMVSLPMPPPPRPAARREAIDAALRKFDGIEDATPAPARKLRWANMDRRSMGALATAAIVAAVSIPVALITLPDMPRSASPELKMPYEAQAPTAAGDNLAQPVADEAADTAAAGQQPPAVAQAPAVKAESKDERMGFVPEEPKEARAEASPAAVVAAAPPPPAPPPPPPPPPAPAPQYTAEAQDMVVTGSRIPQPNLESGGNRQKAASPLVTMDAYGEFLSRLQRALRADNRRAVSGMVGFPLTVNVNGRTETYRSRREVESDFDKIFTPAVKADILGQKPYSLRSRGDGRIKGAERIWFAPACFDRDCSSAGPVLIREVTP